MLHIRFPKLAAGLIAATIGVGAVVLGSVPSAVAQDSVGATHPSIRPQAWQVRRSNRLQILKEAMSNPSVTYQPFNELLTSFESHPLAQTPLENMDLLGTFYAARDGISGTLPLIVMNATLGWYDVLRFSSSSGREEIVNNEAFFKRALVLAGQQRVAEYIAFAKAHPDQVQSAIDQGIALAEKSRNTTSYDRRWPTAYGIERIICAEGGACTTSDYALESQWAALWEQVKLRVRSYYKAS